MNKRLNYHLINGHGIGDIVMTLPLIRCLVNDKINLSFTVKSPVESSLINLFFPSNKFNYIYLKSIYKYPKIISIFIYIYKLRKLNINTIAACFGTNPLLASLVSLGSGAKKRIGWNNSFSFFNTENLSVIPGIHKIHKNLRIYHDKAEVCSDVLTFHLPKNDTIIRNFDYIFYQHARRSTKIIAIAPGSGDLEKHKRWSISNFKEIVEYNYFLRNNFIFLIIGSSEEISLFDELIYNNKNSKNIISLVGKCSLIETLYILAKCNLCICNCNGISHLSNLINIPTLALYGPTDPSLTGISGLNSYILKSNLNCSPCYEKNFLTGCGNAVCMEHISVSSVISKIFKILKL